MPEGNDAHLARRAIALAQTRAGDVAAALATGSTAPTEGDRQRLAGDIAVAQAEAGDLAGARRTALAILDQSLRDGTEFRMLIEQAKRGDARGVLAWAAAQAAPDQKVRYLFDAASTIMEAMHRDRRPFETAPRD